MKQVAFGFALLTLSACGSAQSTSTVQESTDAAVNYVSAEDAKAVIDTLKAAQIEGVRSAGLHPTTTWTFEHLRCTSSIMELAAPGGGGFTTRVMKSCVLENAGQDVKELSGEHAQVIIDALERAGAARVANGGAHAATFWKVNAVSCSQGLMELVAPGGGGFMVRETNSCAFINL